MIKNILIFVFFAVVIASLKPTPGVSELTKVVNETCLDLCKGEK
jgi:hypothetical protein